MLWVCCMQAQTAPGSDPLDPYIEQLEGGKEGSLYQELVDYFYHSQVDVQMRVHTVGCCLLR